MHRIEVEAKRFPVLLPPYSDAESSGKDRSLLFLRQEEPIF